MSVPSIGHNSPPEFDEGEVRPGDWIALSRRVREHPVVGCGQPVKPADPWRGAWSRFEAWFDLLCLAQYRAARVNNRGEVVALAVGQLIGARSYLAGRWNWTEKTVRGFLDTLEDEGMISRAKTAGPLLAPELMNEKNGPAKGQQKSTRSNNKSNTITVCNYEKFQRISDAIEAYIADHRNSEKGQQRASEGPAKGQTLTKETIERRYTSELNATVASAEQPLAGGAVDRKAINRLAARTGFTLWQDTARRCGLPVPRETSFDVYGQKIAARMFEHAEHPRGVAEMSAVWSVAMANIEKSSFLRGLDGKGFRADLKFICQRESFEKLITTGYGNGAHAAGRSEIAAIVGGLADRPITMIGDGDEMADMAARRSRDRGGAL